MAEARTLEGALAQYGPAARARLRPAFDAAHVAYPPARVWLLTLKDERRLELWAQGRNAAAPRTFLKDYEVQAASGGPGPKRVQGDLQVPEGLYRILWLNPASSYHLSMKVDYPNEFDRTHARADKRTQLGGDIFIHGRDVSIGCVAMGDPAIEELFTLAHDAGVANVQAVIAPHDFRKRKPALGARPDPIWLPELYATLQREMALFAR